MPKHNQDKAPKRGSSLAELVSLDIKVAHEGAREAVEALRRLPIKLPKNGEYIVKAVGDTLHIYDTKTGIKKSDTDGASLEPDGLGSDGQEYFFSDPKSKISRVIVHASPIAPDPAALHPNALNALPYLEQIEQLKNEKPQTLAEKNQLKQKLLTLLKSVKAEFDKAQETKFKQDPDLKTKSQSLRAQQEAEAEAKRQQELIAQQNKELQKLREELRRQRQAAASRPSYTPPPSSSVSSYSRSPG